MTVHQVPCILQHNCSYELQHVLFSAQAHQVLPIMLFPQPHILYNPILYIFSIPPQAAHLCSIESIKSMQQNFNSSQK